MSAGKLFQRAGLAMETPLHQQSSDVLAGRDDGWIMNRVMIDSDESIDYKAIL